MKATELRIGNYVNSNIGILKISKIQTDNKDEPKYSGWRIDRPMHGQSEEFIKPIELTEEWLLKLGFEKKEWKEFSYRFSHVKGLQQGYVYNRVWAFILHKDNLCAFGRINTDGNYPDAWNFNEMGLTPRYVHELQNLFYTLTNQELTIKE
jgi:hypothetical protein